MAGTPVVATELQWRRQTEKRLGWLERRPAAADVIFTANTQAEIDIIVAQWGPTTARPLVIVRNDRRPGELAVTTDGVVWQTTVPDHAPFEPLTPSGSFVNFGQAHHKLCVTKSSIGIVVISGLVAGAASGAICTLPAEFRPDHKQLIPVLSNGAVARVEITTAGVVSLFSGSATYTSLENIMFPAAGVATWTPITFSAGWASYHTIDGSFPVAAYWRDPLGGVWFDGLVRQTSPGTLGADSNICVLPFGKNLQSHYPTIGNSVFGTLHLTDGATTTTAVAKAGTQTAWVSLARLMFPDRTVADTWHVQMDYYLNSWIKYVGVFPPTRLMIRQDGIVITDGLVANGTVNATVALGTSQILPERGSLPDVRFGLNNFISGKMVMLAAANNAIARTDYVGYTLDNSPYVLHEQGGSNVWRSRAGLNFMLGG